MSSEGENDKNQAIESEDKKPEKEEEEETEKKAAGEGKTEENEEKPEVKDEVDEKEKPEENDKKESNDASKAEEKNDKPDGNKIEKEEEDGCDEPTEESEKDEEEDEEEEEKNEEEEDGDSEEKEPEKDKKKKNQKEEKEKEKEGNTEIPKGNGTQLGEIPRIDASISRFKNDDLKLLHKLLFKDAGKTAMIKKNIRKFNGYNFKKDSDEYKKKLATVEKFEIKQLKIVCEMLDLEKKGNKEEVSERILNFLVEPKDSGKETTGRGRPKRTAAVKANNRGYSSHDESYSSDEKHTPRARRNMGKRANLKDETSSESDFQPSDNSEEEKPSVKKRKRVGRKKKNDSEEDVSEVDSGTSDDSDDGPKNKKKKAVANSKVVKGKGPGRGRGRRPAASTPAAGKKRGAPPKRGRKRAQESSEEEEEESGGEGDARDEEGSSSEDEPLVKKTAKTPQPPTDEEIRTYVKEILEGANLEEITMKTVCKQVYAHYPNFDLTHKKDYIKTTVKSLIST